MGRGKANFAEGWEPGPNPDEVLRGLGTLQDGRLLNAALIQ